jgi:1,6-anhydro-N-acetylmuramate kinase
VGAHGRTGAYAAVMRRATATSFKITACLSDTAITADAIAATARWFPSPFRRWIVGGGGQRNMAIMNRVQACLGVSVVTTEEAGQDGDAVEAYMIAYLAARYFAGLPITLLATTGADRPCPDGELFLPIGAKSDGTE